MRYTQTELLRQHLYALALGYARQDDQDTLAHDVAMKLATWDRGGDRIVHERLASQPSDWRLIERLSTKANRGRLRDAPAVWVGRHQRASGSGQRVRRGTIDIDPFPIEVHGKQPGGRTTATTRRRSTNRWWPASAPKGITTRTGWAKASCTRSCDEATAAGPRGWCGVLRAGARVVKHGGRLMVDIARAAGALWDKLDRRMQRWWHDPSWGASRPCPRRWIPPPSHAHRCLLLRE